MMLMLRIGMLSFWHVHAKDYARQADEHPRTEVAALWDEQPARGEMVARERRWEFHRDLDELLARPDIDAVIVDTPTTMHRDVMVAAAAARKHIFTEKVLAPTLRECNEIVEAVEGSGIKLTVSLPRLYAGYTVAIKEMLDAKLLGDVTVVRTRLAHGQALSTRENPQGTLPMHFYNRAETVGGAMIDLGCHPMYLARLFGGMPATVTAHYGYVTGREVEDNAVAILDYGNGAIGVVEAGFVNRFSPFTIEVHGTEGSVLFGTPEPRLQLKTAKQGAGRNDPWSTADLPPDQPSAFEQWVRHIEEGTTATENIQMALDLTALMEAATLSAVRGQPVRLDSLAK